MGLQLASNMQMSNLILESDCLSLIQKLNSQIRIETEVGVVIRNIKRMMMYLGADSYKYIKREANGAAHMMAHSMTIWDERLRMVEEEARNAQSYREALLKYCGVDIEY
ncbi:unnamed protein product [Linum tenue]|uniref:RNase H type-1 domain-containing protein n=1 Tax=Linum tenue TaxID=586396 RepID=A0AAV0P4A2_9ROSI|nr:unnamed protein product [Linum tenue]